MPATGQDHELQNVAAALRALDPNGLRTAVVLRDTLDQLYDGQRTGRYRWDQLFKTEKTHCGTLVEINLQREFKFTDGLLLDYQISGNEVDCKFSQNLGGWMIPPETHNRLCLVLWADDQKAVWSMGLVRSSSNHLHTGSNRDRKSTLNQEGRAAIHWLFDQEQLPPNVLLHLDPTEVGQLMAMSSGVQRVNQLFRIAQRMRVGRAVVATVGQQVDYMKRVRNNGGARQYLRPEGIIILGQYQSHAAIAKALRVPSPGPGESVSVRVVPAAITGPGVAEIGGRLWRAAHATDPVVPAPVLPEI